MQQFSRQPAPRKALTALDIAALTLATVGAINWGLSGAANFNVVRRLAGRGSLLERAIYIVVGLAGLDLAWLIARFVTTGAVTPMGPVSRQITAERPARMMQQPGMGTRPTYPQAGTYPPPRMTP